MTIARRLSRVWHPDDLAAAARQRATPEVREHRPWPLPARRWVMGQTWESLLFAHWRVDEAALRRVMPPQIPLDTFDGSAWIGVTPFAVTGMHPRLVPPLPGASRFPEVNVRTYTTIGDRPGIHFFSLDTPNRLAVAGARRTYRLPYFRSRAEVDRSAPTMRFRSARVAVDGPPACLEVEYAPVGPVRAAAPASFEQWATERYCLYTLDGDGRVLRGDIHHPPWPLQAAEASFTVNTLGDQIGVGLDADPVLHFARRQDVLFWPNVLT